MSSVSVVIVECRAEISRPIVVSGKAVLSMVAEGSEVVARFTVEDEEVVWRSIVECRKVVRP